MPILQVAAENGIEIGGKSNELTGRKIRKKHG